MLLENTPAPRVSLPLARVRTSVVVPLWLADGTQVSSEMITFDGLVDDREHLAVAFGDVLTWETPLVRLHSECLTGDVFGSARCDCGSQLREFLSLMRQEGGLLLYLRQEGRGIGLYNKLDAYRLQDGGMDTFEANRALNFSDDQRIYLVAAQMLLALGISEIEILSNNPEKVRQLRAYGISIPRQRLTGVHVTDANRQYLKAKMTYAGHLINIEQQIASGGMLP
jgi:GTP cyclohydrolase II